MKVTAIRYLVVLMLAAFILVVAPAYSQSTTAGDITGVVTDQSGALVTKAKVTATNQATGAESSATTNAEGFYRFSLLPPGSYKITVTATGFQESTRTVQAMVGQSIAANVQLVVSTQTTTVEVTAPAVQISPEVTTTFGSEQISQLPNPGNDLSAVGQTAPGAVMNTAAGFGNFSTFGLPATSNLFTLNGQNDNDPFLNLNNSGATNLLLGTNDVQEATVVNNGYSGQYGQLAGAQVNYVSKSGTNNWHGNAIYYWNGRVMNANNFFNNLNGTPRPFDNANQWAASFGGPIKKDKTFFFFNTEGLRVILPTSTQTLIPSPQFAAGTIANLTSLGLGQSVPFYQNMFSLYQNAVGATAATPFTTCGDAGVTALPAATPCVLQFQSTASNFTHEWQLSFRIDQNFSQSDQLFGRFQTDHGVQATVTDPINPLFNVESNQPEYQGQLVWTHTLNQNAVNEFKASGQWYSAIFTNADRSATLAAFPTTVAFADNSLTTLGGVIGNLFPQGRNVTQYQFVDDFSLTKGKHTMKFGVNYRRSDVTDFDFGIGTSGLVTVNTLNDFFNGGSTGSNLQQNFPTRLSQPMALYGLGIYGQDEWRVTNKLKVTVALRIDHNSNPVCQTNCFSRLVAPFTSLPHNPGVPYNAVLQSGFHQAYPSTDVIVWQPRIGITWSPFANNKTVISGGFGIFGDSFPAVIVDNFASNPPQLAGFTPSNLPLSPTQSPGNPQGNLFNSAAASNTAFSSGFANGATLAQLQALIPGFAPPAVTASDTEIRQPRYQEWNLQVQQSLDKYTVLAVNYVGNHGIFLPVQNIGVNAFGFPGFVGLPPAAPDPRFSGVNQIQSIGISNYNGVTASVRRNFSHGVAFQANYTWSHALDEISNGGFLQFNFATAPSILNPTNPFNLRANYGSADYDVRNYFSMNYVWDDVLRHMFQWGPNVVFKGWALSGTIFTRSGLPFTVFDGGVSNTLAANNFVDNVAGTTGIIFANVTGPTTISSCGKQAAVGAPCLNINGFSSPTTGFGNQARNQFRGSTFFNTDMAVMKNFNIPHWEGAKIGAGVQFFNLFNHPNFDLPVNDITSTQFGNVIATVSNPTSVLGSFLGGDASPRLIQIKAQLVF
ncbi:MAG TPA: TonB-dependent receptor [Candidatus Angelobacter sp.]